MTDWYVYGLSIAALISLCLYVLYRSAKGPEE